MNMTPSRYEQLFEAVQGYQKTGISLVAEKGGQLYPAGSTDDVGIYYFIPKIVDIFNINLDQAVNIFFIGITILSLIAGLIGYFLLFRTSISRWIVLIAISFLSVFLYFFYKYMISDAYVTSLSITIATLPWFLYFIKNLGYRRLFIVFIFFTGIGIGTSHFIRAHSGTAVLIFISFMLLSLKIQWKQKLVFIILLVFSSLIPTVYFNSLLDKRDIYLKYRQPEYEQIPRQHPLWHSIYIGFGFLKNEYVPRYKDEVAIEKVRSIDPKVKYLSREYELTLRNEVFKFIKKHPFFVIETVLAKIVAILIYLLIFANIGLIAAFLYPKPQYVESAFILSLGFSSTPGILVMPYPGYLLGFIAFATVYGIVSINHAIEVRAGSPNQII